ncbi:MAG: nucleotidyltransferase domain-containing protein [Chloroflexota bacterium]|nr:nucleotidyltransferase domain-containing protein [Chloroflexota bacterium]
MSLPPNPHLAPDGRHLRFVESAHRVLSRDPRVKALWAGGSLADGTADRWSDVDLRLAVADDERPAFMAGIEETLQAICPVLGWRTRSTRSAELVVVTFEGPLRADFVVTSPESLDRQRYEPVAPLFDPHGLGARLQQIPYEPSRRTPRELLEREAAQVPAEAGRLQCAIEQSSIVRAMQAQANLLESAQRLLLLLHDPQAAGLPGPKHAADALTANDIEPLLAPLADWSDNWPNPAVDSIESTLDVLRPLASAAEDRYGIAVPLQPQPPGRDADPRPATRVVEAGCFLLVHAMVGATYYNRGMYTGLLWGYAGAARLAAELAYADVRGDAPVPADAPDHLRPEDAAVMTGALRPLRLGGVPGIRRVATRVAGAYSLFLERACARLSLEYPERLDHAVSDYLQREGVFTDESN